MAKRMLQEEDVEKLIETALFARGVAVRGARLRGEGVTEEELADHMVRAVLRHMGHDEVK